MQRRTSQTLSESMSEMIHGVRPEDLSPRDAATLAEQLTNDDAVQRRVLAGDTLALDYIARLDARADGVAIDGPAASHIQRAWVRSEWAEQDEQRREAEQANRLAEADAMVEAHNKRVGELTSLGFDMDVAQSVAARGDAEVTRVSKLDPGSYQRGFETPRVSLADT